MLAHQHKLYVSRLQRQNNDGHTVLSDKTRASRPPARARTTTMTASARKHARTHATAALAALLCAIVQYRFYSLCSRSTDHLYYMSSTRGCCTYGRSHAFADMRHILIHTSAVTWRKGWCRCFYATPRSAAIRGRIVFASVGRAGLHQRQSLGVSACMCVFVHQLPLRITEVTGATCSSEIHSI